ncbi:MAG: hypothetical protein WCJ92_01200 [Alphaproteobacteria bacterium]
MKKVFLALMTVALLSVASDVSARGGKNKKSAAKPAVAAQANPAVAAKKQPQYANKAAKKAAKQQRRQDRKQAPAAQTQVVKH